MNYPKIDNKLTLDWWWTKLGLMIDQPKINAFVDDNQRLMHHQMVKKTQNDDKLTQDYW